MTIKKTRKGWEMEITNEVDGMLEHGGVCGKRVLYSMETLAKLGIGYDANPDDDWNDIMTVGEYLLSVEPDKVLKKGTEIQ